MQSDAKQSNSEELSDGLRELIKKKQDELLPKEEGLLCRIDSDCPPSYVCINGKRVNLFSVYTIP